MLAFLTPFLGFASAFLPDIVKYFQAKLEYAHDEAMRDKDIEAAKVNGQIALDTTLAAGDVQDVISARQSATPSYGAKLLDAMAGQTGWFMSIVRATLIWALSLIEVLNGLMRPVVVYYVMGMWGAVKAGRIYLYVTAAAGGGHVDMALVSEALSTLWTDNDTEIVGTIVGFLFGQRHRLKTIG